jgi:adenylate kinase family enzyme
MPSAFAVLISGPPCAGKSTVAATMSDRLGLPLLSMDLIKSSIVIGAVQCSKTAVTELMRIA